MNLFGDTYGQQFGYPNISQQMPRHAPMQNQYVPFSNKIFVNSLEEALAIRANFNSEMVYFDQNKDVLYNICTDGRGQKSATVIDLSIHKDEPKKEVLSYDELVKKVTDLNYKVEDLYGKYNAKQTDTTDARNDGTTSTN